MHISVYLNKASSLLLLICVRIYYIGFDSGGETRWPRFIFVRHSNVIFNILLIFLLCKSV